MVPFEDISAQVAHDRQAYSCTYMNRIQGPEHTDLVCSRLTALTFADDFCNCCKNVCIGMRHDVDAVNMFAARADKDKVLLFRLNTAPATAVTWHRWYCPVLANEADMDDSDIGEEDELTWT